MGSRGVGRYPHSVADIHPVIYFFSREGVLFPPAKKKSGACYKTCIGYECTDLYYVARATANGWPSFLHP
jgi:hypothetical protein